MATGKELLIRLTELVLLVLCLFVIKCWAVFLTAPVSSGHCLPLTFENDSIKNEQVCKETSHSHYKSKGYFSDTQGKLTCCPYCRTIGEL